MSRTDSAVPNVVRNPDIKMPLAGPRAERQARAVKGRRGDGVAGRQADPLRARAERSVVWVFRALLVVPFVLMAPEVVAVLSGQPGAEANLASSAADVLGTSTFLVFMLMLSVTPLTTVSGWRWHVVLRRDYGRGMFAVALADIVIAAVNSGDIFTGGFLDRLGGRALLFAGTLSTALLVPLVLTSNRRAQKWLGAHWRWVQRLTYVVWVTTLVHLLLLFGFRSFALDALVVSGVLVTLRLPALRRWWVQARRAGTHRHLRASLATGLLAVYLVGLVPFVQELATTGSAAFAQAPGDG